MDGWRVLGKGVNENNKYQVQLEVMDLRILVLRVILINLVNKFYMFVCYVYSCVFNVLVDIRYKKKGSFFF